MEDSDGTGPAGVSVTIDPVELGNAIGSTEPTAEERRHWTPEMRALAERDGATVAADGCPDAAPAPAPGGPMGR